MTAFRSEAVRVLVPASSANVGPGFDSAGLALAVYDELIAMVTDDEGVLVEVAGEGADEVPRDEQHLVVAAMRTAFAAMGQQPTGFVLRCRNAIPHGRGLGSSAAAIIGGMVLARAMVFEESGAAMSDEEVLSLATTMESHPDNLSAALHGGFTIAWLDDAGSPGCVRMNAHPDLRAVLAVPTETLPTLDARRVLPASVSYADAVHNVSRAALLVHAMTRQPDLLWEAMSDRLHQPARSDAYPEASALVASLREAGVPAAISGAGPSVIAVTDRAEDFQRMQDMVTSLGGPAQGDEGRWRVHDLAVSEVGARERPIDSP